jgi:hypothetical protein
MSDQETQPATVQIAISSLVLHGFAVGQGDLIGAAVERELARLVGAGGWPGDLREAVRLAGGAFTVDPGAGADVIGAQIASAVYGACGGRGE